MAADIKSVRVTPLSRALDCKLASSRVYLFFLTIMVIVRPCEAGLNEDSDLPF